MASSIAPLPRWYTIGFSTGVTAELPGIYQWQVGNHGFYVGRYSRKRRPLGEYECNVRRIIAGGYYRKSNPDGFRSVHRALADAYLWGEPIALFFLENALPEELNDRERFYRSWPKYTLNRGTSKMTLSLSELEAIVGNAGPAGVYPSSVIAELRSRSSSLDPRSVRPALDALVSDGRLCRFGYRYFSPANVEAARDMMLRMLRLQRSKFDRLANGDARFRQTEHAINQWSGQL